MRKTKIVATIGPACESEEMLEQMIKHGLNTARLNMSHGCHEEHKVKIDRIMKLNQKLGSNVAIMLDTKGPEIRLGDFKEGKVLLVEGKNIKLVTDKIEGTEQEVHITYENITRDVIVGTEILLNDGAVSLTVVEIGENFVNCRINNTGLIKSRRGVNIPKTKITLPSLTDIDKADIAFGIENGVDYIAASFIRKKEDVEDIKEYLKSLNAENVKIISKIESDEGIQNFDEILEVSDGIMVARGDMGVEVPIDTLPGIQKKMIKKTIEKGKLVITATQMLESMISCPKPTRAEVSDVANAIYDSTSAIMLSGETASGNYPIECIDMMSSIAETTEGEIDYWNRFKKRNVDKMGAYVTPKEEYFASETAKLRKQINFSVCSSALFVDAKAIISVSENGKTPAVLSGFRPACPIYVFTANKKTYNQLNLEWGIKAVYIEGERDYHKMLQKGIDKLVQEGSLKKEDVVILGSGATPHKEGNNISMQTMGALIRI